MTLNDKNVIKNFGIILYYQADNGNPSQEHFNHS